MLRMNSQKSSLNRENKGTYFKYYINNGKNTNYEHVVKKQ